jgi:hypothetical protein
VKNPEAIETEIISVSTGFRRRSIRGVKKLTNWIFVQAIGFWRLDGERNAASSFRWAAITRVFKGRACSLKQR